MSWVCCAFASLNWRISLTLAERKARGLTLARGHYRCYLCHQMIERGEAYHSQKCGPWNNTCEEPWTGRSCRFCWEIFEKATDHWRNEDFQDSDHATAVEEYVLDLQRCWDVYEEIAAVKEWERMTKAARERLFCEGHMAPSWAREWIDKPRPLPKK
jgi:hypothetical protein